MFDKNSEVRNGIFGSTTTRSVLGVKRPVQQTTQEEMLEAVEKALYKFELEGMTSNKLCIDTRDPLGILAFPVFNEKRPSVSQLERYMSAIKERFRDSSSIVSYKTEMDGDQKAPSQVLIYIKL